jgi:putative N6-adenine-specific DNA methylase
VLHAELTDLRLARVERQVGGVYFEGSSTDAMRVNLESRVAVRVLRRVSRFLADSSDALYEGALAVEWSRFLKPGASLLVAAQTRESALDHSLFVEQRVKDAICDEQRAARGERPEVDKDQPDLRVHAHLFRDRCTLSVDTSGESLHRRGWRRFQGPAPLAETLAAGLLSLSGWDRRSPLIDPFCGSATLLVEAALLAAGRAPGLSRASFAFEAFPDHEAARWRDLRAAAEARVRLPRKLQLLGSDADRSVVEGARQNLAAAGVGDSVRLEFGRAEDFTPRAGWNGWIVTNPPYGERVGSARELVAVYRRFGERLRNACAGYHLALFSGNPELDAQLGLEFASRTKLANGAISCELLRAEL